MCIPDFQCFSLERMFNKYKNHVNICSMQRLMYKQIVAYIRADIIMQVIIQEIEDCMIPSLGSLSST